MRKDFECFGNLESGQVRAEAVVHAAAEGQYRRRRRAGDVEVAGIVINCGITAGCKGIHENKGPDEARYVTGLQFKVDAGVTIN